MGLFDFLVGIVETMQNWRDEIQFPYPGYRDRIVQISQLPDEGGLNLNMPKPHVDALSDAGVCAAIRIVERFVPNPATPGVDGWVNHEDIRLRTFLALMEERVTEPTLHDPMWNASCKVQSRTTITRTIRGRWPRAYSTIYVRSGSG